MKKGFLIVVLLHLLILPLLADNFQLKGVVKDQKSGEALPFANVLMLSITDTNFTIGAISNNEGMFVFDQVPKGSYILKASYMGYETKQISVEFLQKKLYVEMGLQKKSFKLTDVEITAERQISEETIEKTTINVAKNTSNSGGNAMDVMKTLPSVDVDINGQIRYRGSNRVRILLDGKPSELLKTLEQIPADQIEKIEIINNPSAKYEADGMSGIINIKMKKGGSDGSGTSLNAYLGLPETYGGSFGFFEQSGKSKMFARGSFNRKTQFQTKEHWRYNYEDLYALDYYQYDRQDQILNNLMINTGMDYQINPKQQIGISFIGSGKLHSADRSINYQSWDKQANVLFNSNKDIEIFLRNYVIDGNVDYQIKLTKTQKLKALFNINYLEQTQEMSFDFYPLGSSNHLEHDFQNTFSDQLNKTADFSLDYSWNISDSSSFESGYRYTHEDLLNDFRSESYSFDVEEWISDSTLNNHFHYLQNIHAFYINWDTKLKYFHFQLGLRGEYTTTNQFIKEKDNYLDWFPSVMLSKKLDKRFSVYASYNRRINRPILKMINPYTNEYADRLNMHIGNPDLKPEYVNSIELGTRFSAHKTSAKISGYYRHINQAISRVKTAVNDSALWVTFMNLDQAQLFGGELSFSVQAFKWWNINANTNVFYTSLVGTYGPNQIDRSHTGFTANMNHQFRLPWKLQMQWYFYYKSELPDVLGTYMERYYADAAISKKVLKNKGKIIFKISDVFNTYRYGLDLVGLDEDGYHYSQKNRRKNESQYFILSFVYNFTAKEKQKKEHFFLEGFGK